ncbi:capsule biosynthesis GfcC family protein [Photobacterium sp.]|uniref:capsule biosynthesis GfcC family protein n=1 Tax=Photobacterium sp. TaxID=660 RepID=UPI00299EC10F|nr:capsule biosynthesis GfcC family protein [Photobacterium sp.]MDX1303645.1 capsule biosynthesis GfcC family protein [Photobacterium sp.]
MKTLSLLFRSVVFCCAALSHLFSVAPVYAQTQVSVATSINVDQVIPLTYPAPVRLEQVLADSLANIKTLSDQVTLSTPQPVFWSGAALFDLQHFESFNQQRQTVLNQLEQLAEEWNDDAEQFHTVTNLISDISGLKLSNRIFIPLDLDLIRINTSHNPLLDGDYQLILPIRPKHVWVLGTVKRQQNVPWQQRADANYYLNQITVSENTDNSVVWVIQPDGVTEIHSIAYWNKKHKDIAPGATVFVGFNSLPSKFSSLNQDIVELLRNRAL